MKVGRNFVWVFLLGGLGGCQNPMHNPALKSLEAECQGLAAKMDLDHTASGLAQAEKPARPPGTYAPGSPERDEATLSVDETNPIQLAAAIQAAEKKETKKLLPFFVPIPPDVPGSNAPPIKMPKGKAEFEKELKRLYPDLPPLEAELVLAPGPEGRPMTLADLQRLATQYSPAIRAAEAAVTAARGAVRQALTHPNPTFAYEGDTMATFPAGYQGFYVDQVIKTGNKLQLQGAAATMDLLNAQLALRKVRNDVSYQVRSNYFAVLVALENVKVSRAFAKFTEEIYSKQVTRVRGISAVYEPMQLRPLAWAARFNLIQAINQYHASWRQLASSLGLRDMPPSDVAGRVDLPIPEFDYQEVLSRMLSRHTDVLSAENNIQKARYLLKLAQTMPIPDVDVHVLVQKDYTTPPFLTVPSVAVSVPLPVWDRNVGNIQQAQGFLNQAMQNLPLVRNNLTNSLADAFNRYLTARRQVEISLLQMADQVRVYQKVYQKHSALPAGDPDAVTFGDVVTAQQTLAGYLTGYITALGLQWTAVVDVANLLQTDDLFKGTGTKGKDNPDVPPLDHLESLFGCPPEFSGSALSGSQTQLGQTERDDEAESPSSVEAQAPSRGERPRALIPGQGQDRGSVPADTGREQPPAPLARPVLDSPQSMPPTSEEPDRPG